MCPAIERVLALAALLLSAVCACKPRSSPAASTTATASADAVVPGPGEGTLTTEDGRTRRYFTYWPKTAGPKPPLLLVLHGGGGTAEGARSTSFSHAAARRHGWFVVYPEGVTQRAFGKDMATWNAGVCCGKAKDEDVDDVGFLLALLDHLEKQFAFDPERVFATGISNGGMMATRLACERPDRIAGISAVASPGYVCKNAKPVAVQIIHGTDDRCALYGGGSACGGCWERVVSEIIRIPLPARSFPCTGAEDQVAFWREVNGCTNVAAETLSRGNARCVRYDDCTSHKPVSFCKVEAGGHTWPGGKLGCDPEQRACKAYADMTGTISDDLDANEAMIDLFATVRP